MNLKINKISTLNQKMKTIKTPSLSWQNKLISTALASVALFMGAPLATYATLPVATSPNLTLGGSNGAGFTTSGTTTGGAGTLTITAGSTNTVLNWINFSDGTPNGGTLTTGDTINFNLPSSSSAVLNNITGSIPTVLGGAINSNGNVFFLNPAGIVIGSSSVINVANLFVSTVPQIDSISYFLTNGTLGVFNGAAQAAVTGNSGIVYIQSGASITPTAGTGSVNLASAYNGSGVQISGNYGGALPTTGLDNSKALPGSASTSWAIPAGPINVSGANVGTITTNTQTLVKGINIDSLSYEGSLNIYSINTGGVVLGNNMTGNAGAPTSAISLSAAYVPSLGSSQGGALNVNTTGGAITVNTGTTGILSTANNIVFNTTYAGVAGVSAAAGTQAVNINGTISDIGSLTITNGTGAVSSNTAGVISAKGVSVTTNSGSFTNSATITTTGGGNFVVNTTGSNNGNVTGPFLALATITSAGNIQITTNGGNISANAGSTANKAGTGIADLSTGTLIGTASGSIIDATSSNLTNSGNVEIYGDFGGTVTRLAGNKVNFVDTQTVSGTQRTVTTVNALTSLTANSMGGLAFTTVNTGGVVMISSGGNLQFGDSTKTGTAAQTSNVQGSAAVTLNAYGTVKLYGTTFANSNISISSTNGTAGTIGNLTGGNTAAASGAITIDNVTAGSGNVVISNNTGAITISGFNATATGGTFGVTTNNGYITVSNTTTNGSTTITSLGTNGKLNLGFPSDYITLTNLTDNATAAGSTLTVISNNGAISGTNVVTYGGGNVTFTNTTGGITLTGTNILYGPVSMSSANNINVSNVTLNKSSLTGNTVSLGVSSINASISWTGGIGDVAVTPNLNTTSNASMPLIQQGPGGATSTQNGYEQTITNTAGVLNSTETLTIATTGNLYVTNNVMAKSVTLTAGTGLYTMNVDTNGALGSTIALTSGNDISNFSINGSTGPITQNRLGYWNMPGQGGSLTLTTVGGLSGVTGNVSYSGTQTGTISANSYSVSLSSTQGNVTVAAIGSGIVTANGLTVYAPSGTATLNSLQNTNAPSSSLALGTVTITANVLSMTGTNVTPTLVLAGGAGNMAVNTSNLGSLYTTNINTGTGGVKGNVSVTSNGAVLLGTSSSSTVAITGNLTVDLSSDISSTAAGNANSYLSTVASAASVGGLVSITTNNSAVTLGTIGGTGSFGQISVAQGGTGVKSPVTITSSTDAVLGNINASTLTITTSGNVTNPSGVVTASGATTISTGNATVPGSITLGAPGTTGSSLTTLNAQQVTNLAITASPTSTITITSNAALNNVTLTGNGAGSIALNMVNGSVANLTIATNSGTGSFTGNNAVITSGNYSTLAGGLNIQNWGTGSLGTFTTNLGAFGTNSTIINNGSFTVSNLIDSGAATGTLLVSSNANNSNSSTTTLTLGTGINLAASSGTYTFRSGNASDTAGDYGNIADTSSAAVSINAGTTTFIGKSIQVNNGLDNFSTVAFTSNGSVNYVETGAIKLGAVTVGKNATSFSLTSSTGFIDAGSNVVSITANSIPVSFIAATTGNSYVQLGSASNQFGGNTSSTADIVSITSSGNTTINLKTGADLVLGTVKVWGPSDPTQTSNSQFSATLVSGNVNQSSTGSMYVWGNTNITTTATGTGTTGGINLNKVGNNFGAINLNASTTGNINMLETATTAINTITGKNVSLTSAQGDIIRATTNSAMNINGTSSFSANNVLLASTDVTKGDNFNSNPIYISANSNASILSSVAGYTTIATGTKVTGNLTVTTAVAGGVINDQGGLSTLTVGGSTSLTASAGSISFTASQDQFQGGLATVSTGSSTIYSLGNLVLLPGSNDAYETLITSYLSTTSPGSVTTSGSGSSTYGSLYITSPSGTNVTFSNPTKITTALSINAPMAAINLGTLGKAVDLNNITPVITGNASYIPPQP
jgi:hypothetical protein